MEKKKNVIVDLSLEFALEIIDYCQLLENARKHVLANQLLKSGTSIGANIREAQNAESLVDFIHKNKIALKEAEETVYWLLLCSHQKQLPSCGTHLTAVVEIKKILNAIIATSKTRLKQKKLISCITNSQIHKFTNWLIC